MAREPRRVRASSRCSSVMREPHENDDFHVSEPFSFGDLTPLSALIPAHQRSQSTRGCFTPQRSSRPGEVVASGHETRSWIRGAPGDIPCTGLASTVRTGQEKVCLSQSRQDKAGEASQMSLNDEVIALNHLCTKMVRFFRRQQ